MGGYVAIFFVNLIHLLFSIYISIVMLRFLMQLFQADFGNPIAHFIIKITNPVLRPLRRIIPGLGGIDLAAVFLILTLQIVEIFLLGLIPGVPFPSTFGIIPALLGLILQRAIYLYFFSLLIHVVISWVNPQAFYHPVGRIVIGINEPLLRPLRRIIPPIGGLDISIFILGIILMACNFLVALPLIGIAFPHGYL